MHSLRLFTVLAALLCASVAGASPTAAHKVAENDCGNPARQCFLVKGNGYTMPSSLGSTDAERTCTYGDRVIYAFGNVNPSAAYRLEAVYLSDGPRRQRLVADGRVLRDITLPPGRVHRETIDLPAFCYAYGKLILTFECLAGPNAIVSELRVYSSDGTELTPLPQEEVRALRAQPRFNVRVAPEETEKALPKYTVRPRAVRGVYNPILSLNGTWQFCPAPAENFWTRPADTSWKSLAVPGHWAMQGFSVRPGAWAGYRKTFRLPDDWQGSAVKLRFDGVHSEYSFYVNGQPAGSHLGGMTVCEADITRLLKPGINEIALRVRSESEADRLGSLTQYANFQLGGILRKVTLFAVPTVHMTDLRITATPSADLGRASFSLRTTLRNSSDRPTGPLSLRVSFRDLPNILTADTAPLAPGEERTLTLKDTVLRPRLWTPETPNLYDMTAELHAGTDVLESAERRIGFRSVEVRGQDVLVNGRAVKLRGVCHHETHPLAGRAIPPELERSDVLLYRAGNCNFIRTSHYPPCEELTDICDELGMFLEVEAPVCWIGHGANATWSKDSFRDPKHYGYVLQSNLEMIQTYRNAPSVLMWSVANESLWNAEFARVSAHVANADPTRPYTFHDQAYGGFNNLGSNAPVANMHYPGPDGCTPAAKDGRPMTFGEFCHLNVYNRRETATDPGVRNDWALALAPMWEKMFRTRGVLGGSIWSGVDDIFCLPDGSAVGYGPWGPIDGWRRPKPEYCIMKKVYSPLRVLTQTLTPGSTCAVTVENRHTWLNTNDLGIRYTCGTATGKVSADIPAGTVGTLNIPAGPAGADTLTLTFTDPRGFDIDSFTLPIGKPLAAPAAPKAPAPAPTRLEETATAFVARGGDAVCTVSKATGRIVSLTRGGKPILVGGPYLMALPLIGEACFPRHRAHIEPYTDVCVPEKTLSVTAKQTSGTDVVFSVRNTFRGFAGGYTLTFSASGTLTADYSYTSQTALNPRQVGLVFETPKTFGRLLWSRSDPLMQGSPDTHIGRTAGSAPLFYDGVRPDRPLNVRPATPWHMDATALGSADFRATRRNIRFAALTDSSRSALTLLSDGTQHTRAWLNGNTLRFLIADFVSPGNEMFLGSHYARYRKPIRKGDTLRGTVRLLAGPLPAEAAAVLK